MSLPKTFAKFIWYFIKKQKAYFIAIQVLAAAWAIDNTIWPYAFKLLIDKLLNFTQDKSEIWWYLAPVLLFWVFLWLLIEVMFRIQGFLIARAFPQIEAHIRMSMFKYVSDHSYDFFANHFAGNISNKISDMAQSATRILQLVMTMFIPAFLALVIASSLFFTIHPVFALILITWAVVHMGVCFLSAKKCSNLSHIHATSRSLLTGKIVDTFTNIINVKLFTKQKFEVAYVGGYQKDEQQKHRASAVFVEKIKIALGISALIFPMILLTWYEIYSWQQGFITIGDLVFLFNATWNIMFLAWVVGLELPNLFKEIGICQQALSVIKAPHDIIDAPKAMPLQVKKGSIAFDHVTFEYIKNRPVFESLSLEIKAGTKVGLVGFSGSGKSTFVNLLMRFFDIQSGTIRIDDTDIRQTTLDSLRGQISMIPQDPTLFHRSLMDNIRYGKPEASMDEIIAASKHAHCHGFITDLPEGYDALVGERGIKLSGGQRQRVAIARAILDNAPIFILDEATSSLDSVTEKHIQDGLKYLMEGRTTIVIAHRLSTLSEMDRILVFSEGKVVEDGTHESLLSQEGHYALLWRMQAGGFLPDRPENIQV